MVDCDSVARAVRDDGDPRVRANTVRCLPARGDLGAVLLVGVVHDHPASLYRVTHLVETTRPAVLALELPPLAVPLFKLYAHDDRTPPGLGGEMSVAVRAAGDARVVGIDGPSLRYLWALAGRARDETGVGPAVLRDTLTDLGQALATRVGAVLGRYTPLRPYLYQHIGYEVTPFDSPETQAAHETAHVERQQTFMRAVTVPPARRVVNDAREATMLHRLRTLRRAGDVVAVVGMKHLDVLGDRLVGEPTP